MRTAPTLTAIALLAAFAAKAQQSGDLDSTFSADGITTTDLQPPSSDGALCMALQPDGRIIVAGNSLPQTGGTTAMALARYLPDGTLDPTFGTGGTVVTAFGTFDDGIMAIALQPDGKIVVGGWSWANGLGYGFLVARYDSTGTLDPSFSGDGIQVDDLGTGSEDRANAVAIQADGKIVAAGSVQNADYDMVVCRYNSDGSFDTTFSGDGHVTIGFGTNDDRGSSLVIQPDGMIVIAGYTGGGSDADFAIVRLTTAGVPDAGFGTNGTVFTSFTAGPDQAGGLLLQPDGKLVAGGGAWNGTYTNIAFARYETNGDLDNTFAGDGTTTYPIGFVSIAGDLALLPDGRIVAGGYSDIDFLVAVLNPDGSPDVTFSGDGAQATNSGNNEYGNDVAVQPDGKILLAGYSNYGATLNDFVVLRYHTDLSIGVLELGESRIEPLVFPDPIGDEATLRFTLEPAQRLNIHLVDDAGRTVHRFVEGRTFPTGPQQLTLRFAENIAAGSYTLVIAGERGSASVRVVKE